MQAIRAKDTLAELSLRRELHRRGRRFFVNRRVLGDRRSVDLVFPTARVAVFVDGCFWHGCPLHGRQPSVNTGYWSPKLAGNIERDRRTDEDLAAAGWTVVRIWAHEPIDSAADRVERALPPRSSQV
jgi:DNA mismatch endonuclease (patch repair protein)